MIAENAERHVGDRVKRSACEDEWRTGAIDLLSDLPGGLTVNVEVLNRKGEFSVDVAVTVLGCQRVLGQRVGEVIPRAVERVAAILADQHPSRGIKVRAAVLEQALKGRE